jgi:hypothetical protein
MGIRRLVFKLGKGFIKWLELVVEEFTDENTTTEEKTRLVSGTAGFVAMAANSTLTFGITFLTFISLIVSPVKKINDANKRNEVLLNTIKQEQIRLSEMSDNICPAKN